MGQFTALVVLAEIGDITRFPSARKLASWAGLTPTVRGLDRTVRHGHISKQGSAWLRAHASFAATMAVLEASDQPVIISHGQLGHEGSTHPRLPTTRHVAAVAAAGGLIGAWPCGLTSRSLADFATEIIRLTEVAGLGHVAIGTDLDGNYRPVLTSYDQLAGLTGLLRDRGLPAAHVRQILGSNAADLLNRTFP